MATNKPKLTEDPLITSLIPDPAEIPGVRVHWGLIGKSLRKGYWRLYTSPNLDSYLEIRDEDVLHSESLTTDVNGPKGSAIWIKADAEVKRVRSTESTSHAGFLAGDITQGFLQSTRVGGGLSWGTWTTIFTTTICIIIYTEVKCTSDCDTVQASSPNDSCCMCSTYTGCRAF